MFRIAKEFSFSAGHFLNGLPREHPCSKMHGHNYVVTVILEDETLDATGFIVDYRDLASLKEYIDQNLDHKVLNDVLTFNPTAERLAAHLYDIFKAMLWQVACVRVSETSKTWAEYHE